MSDFPCIPVLYMGASESKQEEDHTEQLIRNVKIALVGTYGVGKTSIITRYIDQKFSSEYIYTRGGNIRKKSIKVYGRQIQIELIDTGGQEYQKKLVLGFFTKAQVHGVVLVHDISKPNSFNEVEDWLTDIRQHSLGDPVIMLIGNKNDLDPCAKFDDPSTIPQNLKAGPARVPYEQCERKTYEQGLLPFYGEVSAKTGMNIESIIELLVKEILHQQNKLLGSIWEPDLMQESIKPSTKPHENRSRCVIL